MLLNLFRQDTGRIFHLSPVLDFLDPRSAVNALDYLADQGPKDLVQAIAGSEIQAMLARMPEEVRLGGADIRGYQIRLDEVGTVDYEMQNSVLLITFLSFRQSGESFMLPDDKLSHQNWEILNGMFEKYYPEVSQ
jgi:hypothetical protein